MLTIPPANRVSSEQATSSFGIQSFAIIRLTIHSDAPLTITTVSLFWVCEINFSIAFLYMTVALFSKYLLIKRLRNLATFLGDIPHVTSHRSTEKPINFVYFSIKKGRVKGSAKKHNKNRIGLRCTMNFIYSAPVSLFIIVLSKSNNIKFTVLNISSI